MLVDDQPENINHLKSLLLAYDKVNVVAEAGSLAEAEPLIRSVKPDLLFLDVELKDGTGFDLLKRLPEFKGHVVIVTAYEKYAVRAFRANAVDYLLKPADRDELQETMAKVLSMHKLYTSNGDIRTSYREAIQMAGKLRISCKYPDRIIISSHSGIEMVNVCDISYIEAQNSYSALFLNSGRKLTTSRPLLEFEDVLDRSVFFRVHRSYLVHASSITRLNTKPHSVELKSGISLPVSRRKFASFHEFLRGYSGVA